MEWREGGGQRGRTTRSNMRLQDNRLLWRYFLAPVAPKVCVCVRVCSVGGGGGGGGGRHRDTAQTTPLRGEGFLFNDLRNCCPAIFCNQPRTVDPSAGPFRLSLSLAVFVCDYPFPPLRPSDDPLLVPPPPLCVCRPLISDATNARTYIYYYFLRYFCTLNNQLINLPLTRRSPAPLFRPRAHYPSPARPSAFHLHLFIATSREPLSAHCVYSHRHHHVKSSYARARHLLLRRPLQPCQPLVLLADTFQYRFRAVTYMLRLERTNLVKRPTTGAYLPRRFSCVSNISEIYFLQTRAYYIEKNKTTIKITLQRCRPFIKTNKKKKTEPPV